MPLKASMYRSFTHTERFKRSAIPSMIRLLNDCQKKKEETFKKLNAMPVNHVCCSSLYHHFQPKISLSKITQN